jgi:glyoxylase-like metal-dependent hydrolase (beta-lactamase superfamily II)
MIDRSSGYSVLIDPGAEPEILQVMLAGGYPKAILLTHAHADHVGALGVMRKKLMVPVIAHSNVAANVEADRRVNHGDQLPLGDHMIVIYHTPGHTEDQVCIGIEGDFRMIVGDTIFAGGPGKTWSEDGFRQTLTSLREVVLSWPDDTICYPGHGPSFRLGDIRPAVERFLATDHGGFFGDATWE